MRVGFILSHFAVNPSFSPDTPAGRSRNSLETRTSTAVVSPEVISMQFGQESCTPSARGRAVALDVGQRLWIDVASPQAPAHAERALLDELRGNPAALSCF